MPEYRVVYEDTVEADSLVEAALKLEQILAVGIDFRPTIRVEEIDTGDIDTFDLDEEGSPEPLGNDPEVLGLYAVSDDGTERLLGTGEFSQEVLNLERNMLLMDWYWDDQLDSAGYMPVMRRL